MKAHIRLLLLHRGLKLVSEEAEVALAERCALNWSAKRRR